MANRISRDGREVALEPKVMEVLVCLAGRPGSTVTKEDFFETVWAGTVVTDDVLSRCISELRKNFGDDAREPQYVETIRKTGYRLIAAVSPVTDETNGFLRAAGEAASPTRAPASTRRLVGLALGVIIAILAAVAFLSRSDHPEPAGGQAQITRPFTSIRGLELDPAFAPDGNRVAFASNQTERGQFDIFLKQEGSDASFRLTSTEADERYPAWSPDGLFVAFFRDGDSAGVFVKPSLGGRERLIAPMTGRDVAGVSWSPSGGWLAVSAQSESFGPFAVFLMDTDSDSVRQVTVPAPFSFGDVSPVFSPSGDRIAFVRGLSAEIRDLFIADVSNGELTQITSDSTAIGGIAWTPDNRSIVYSSARDPGGSLWRINVQGGEIQLVESGGPATSLESPSITLDGGRLSYVHRTANANIWRVYKPRRNDTYRNRPAIFSTHFDSNPDISPDGSKIVFTSRQTGRNEIWVADPDGGNQAKLTSIDGAASYPKWSPSGEEIAFELRMRGRADIYTVKISGGKPVKRVDTPGEDVLPSWSRDGLWIYFSTNRDGRWQIWRTSIDDGRLEQVTHHGGRFGMESPDGSAFFFVRPDTVGVWKITEIGSTDRPVLVYPDLDPRDWGNWVVAPSGIYHVSRTSYVPSLVFTFFNVERPTQIITLGSVPDHPSLTAAEDFSWFAYTLVDDEGADIMIKEGFLP